MKRSKIWIFEANIFSDPINIKYTPDFIYQIFEFGCMIFVCRIVIIKLESPADVDSWKILRAKFTFCRSKWDGQHAFDVNFWALLMMENLSALYKVLRSSNAAKQIGGYIDLVNSLGFKIIFATGIETLSWVDGIISSVQDSKSG